MNNKTKNTAKRLLVELSQSIIKNELLRKRITVFIHNVKAIHLKTPKEQDIFDYKQIIKNKKYYCHDYYKGNSLYGISRCLQKYSSYDKKIRACIEHGVYFGDTVNEIEYQNSGLPAIITYSDEREQTLLSAEKNKIIYKIGPYIEYAEPALSQQEINDLKRKNGKTLLVFPSHSIEEMTTSYDIDALIEQIEKVKAENGFKTIIVSLYYKDIELGVDKKYRDKGYIVVSAGYKYDPNFLSRLKTFILLSDYTVSNNIGTHIGYCIYLNKPHTVINQKINYRRDNKKEGLNINESYEKQKEEVLGYFSRMRNTITPGQKKICNKYWGFEYVRSKKDLNLFFKKIEKIK